MARKRNNGTTITAKSRAPIAPVEVEKSAAVAQKSASTAALVSLTETAYEDRTYYASPVLIQSADGLITIEASLLHTIDFLDPSNNPVRLTYKAPS